MAEADAMVDACERHGVLFNYGTQRRYIPVYRKLRAMIGDGAVGKPHAVIAHYGVGAALWGHTHTVDLIQFMAGDAEIEFVQGTALARDDQWDGDRLTIDPGIPMGYARFKNGIHGYMVAGTGNEVEVSGSDGNLRTLNDAIGVQWRRTNQPWRLLEETPFPEVPWQSGTVNGIRELIDALDGGPAPTGGIRLARQSIEMVMGFVASHRKGGVRVPLPLAEREMAIRPEGW
jgi:predicted dehydrogenase